MTVLPTKPLDVCVQDEKLRIEALGGCVIWFGTWRVNGSLSVSRAIGELLINTCLQIISFSIHVLN